MESDFNLYTWEYLQANNYFQNHNCYKSFQLAKEDPEIIEKIRDKVMVDIGCGYGRETYYFSKYAKKVYAIDVSSPVLNLANKFISEYGNYRTVKFVLAKEYEDIIKEPIDFVYSRHVFQHITPHLAKRYLKHFAQILRGEIDILFRVGDKKKYPLMKEPLVEYTNLELAEMLEKYHFLNVKDQIGNNYHLRRIHATAKSIDN